MAQANQLLIKAQCAETMTALSTGDVLGCLQSEMRPDVKFRLCERLVFLIYQDSNFGLLPIDPSYCEVLERIIRLCKSSICSGFSPSEKGDTFAGPSKDSNSPNNDKERILSAMLLSVPKKEIPEVLSHFSYPSTASFSQKLLANDERFLTCLISLLPLIDILPCDSIFHPVSVFLESMHLISYDCEVLIDWLNSELSASSLILRTLKSNIKNQNLWKSYVPKEFNQKTTVKKWRKEHENQSDEPIVSLKITEIVGDQKMTKQLDLFGMKSRNIEYEESTSLQNCGSFARWAQMVVEFRERLHRLLAANLIAKKLDVLLKWCDKFCEVFSPTQ